MSEAQPAPNEPSATTNLLPPAPRKLPPQLSRQVSGPFVRLAGFGIIVSLVLLAVGMWLEDGYRDLLEMKYYGEYIEAQVTTLYEEEGEYWAAVAYRLDGQIQTAEVDLPRSAFDRVVSYRAGEVATVPVVVWPEAPAEPESVEWIDAQGGFFEFVWAYWLGAILLVLTVLWGLSRLLSARKVLVKGREVRGVPTGDVTYSAEAKKFTMRVVYADAGADLDGTPATVSWDRGASPAADFERRLVLLAPPSGRGTPHVVTEDVLEAFRAQR